MKITASLKQQSFLWDFAVDGGAASSINMGVFIPANAIIHSGYIAVLTTLTSGGSATVAIGFSGSTGALIPATAISSLTAGTVIDTIEKVNLSALQQLQLTIAAAALTAGKIICVIEYEEFAFQIPALTAFTSKKVYSGLLNQAGVANPVATLSDNTIGAIVWTRLNVGEYRGTLTGAFPLNKTLCFTQQGNNVSPAFVNIGRASANFVDLFVQDILGLPADDLLINTSIEIRTYN